MENHWQKLWNSRKINFDELSSEDEQRLVLELKRIVGWDFHGKKSSVTFDEFKKEYGYIKSNLGFGGSDYAENLLNVAKQVIGAKNLVECLAGEAVNLPTEIKYDAVFSAGVFVHFSDLNYAEKVLDRMVAKAKHSVGILRNLDEATKDKYLAYRRANTKNYDELYKDLPKLFIAKDFFTEYAAKNNLTVKFDKHHIEGFWNEPFIFDCFLYKGL